MEYTNIGGVKIEKTAALAPMASVADRAYRIMAKEYGARRMRQAAHDVIPAPRQAPR